MLNKLFRPVDNSPLIVFRIIFGLLLTAEAWGAIMTGWVRRAFIDPQYNFPFIDFSWLHPLPGDGMYYYYAIMGAAGVMITLGLYYRASMSIYAIMWAGVYLMQKTNYNNHYYLMMVLCFLMVLMPAHRYASLDVKRKPALKSLSCPQWCLSLFAYQMAVVYVFASLAKMYPGWLRCEPIEIWFAAKSDYWLVGPLLAKHWFQVMVAYLGVAFDLIIGPGLLWKKTRKYAFIAAVFFHLFNSAIFQVGVFPYMGIAISIFFFDPDLIKRIFLKRKPVFKDTTQSTYSPRYKQFISGAFIIYFAFQIMLPLRHWFFPGEVHWTEEGHRLSWRMMLRVKSGSVFFIVVDPKTKEEWKVHPIKYLTRKQSAKIATHPDMCWQFVQILKDDYAQQGYPDVQIFAHGKAKLNQGEYHPLYNPEIDLARVEWKRFSHSEWLLPFKSEL